MESLNSKKVLSLVSKLFYLKLKFKEKIKMNKKRRPVNEKDFYDQIISWRTLLKKGYFDFQEFNNTYHYDDTYGKTDVIYPNYFNLKTIFKKKGLLSKLESYEYYSETKSSYSFADTTPILFTIPKTQDTRRPLKFPNLYSYCLLIKIIVDNKEEIISALMSDKESTSRFFGYNPYRFNVTKSIKDKLLIGHTYYFKTDFSNFYHSFYTHAIAWILMGKEKAKKNRRDKDNQGEDIIANLIDHGIRAEQNNETHGLPTGNLLTRIIVEFFMSNIDKEIRIALSNTSVTFNRYVDDIIFGYDNPQDLNLIKKILQQVAQKYDITINDRKTVDTDFKEIQRGSQLIGYFNEIQDKIKFATIAKKLRKNPKVYNVEINAIQRLCSYKIKDEYDIFYTKVNNELLQGIKGSGKLAFRVLMFFLNSIRYDKGERNKSKEPVYQSLHALIEKEDTVQEDIQSSFIEKMLQLVFSDFKLMLPFIQLLDVIQKREKEINNHLVTYYLKDFVEKLGMGTNANRVNFFSDKLMFYIKNGMHQEAYSILLLFNKLNVQLPAETINQVQLYVYQNNKNIDDFTMLFFVHNFAIQSNLSQLDKNHFFNMIEKILKTDNGMDQVFRENHWLLRYEIFYLYKTNPTFKNNVKAYYNIKRCDSKNMDYNYFLTSLKTLKKKINSNKLKGFEKRTAINSYQISNFFNMLLEANVSFTDFEWKN